jgi:hypothetical protein
MNRQIVVFALFLVGILCSPVVAKYGGGTGEPNDPYLIYTAQQMNAIGAEPNDWDKHFKLMADIDLSGFLYQAALIAPDTNSAKEYQGTSFIGVLDGNGHTISHLTIQGGSYLALFGQLGSGANVSNLGLEAVDVHGNGDYAGGLAGYNDGRVTNCYSTGSVTGGSSVGGIVGGNWGVITDCNSSAMVSGTEFAGGLVGTNDTALGPPIGPQPPPFVWPSGVPILLIGGTIRDCHSSGTVTGNADTGGLVGRNSGFVTRCYSSGAVSFGDGVGGLVGRNGRWCEPMAELCSYRPGTVTNCYSTGFVSGHFDVGGLVGENSFESTITNCYQTGRVEGDRRVGGLLGSNGKYVGATVANCYSTGFVWGHSDVGGLVGSVFAGPVADSYWDIETSGETTSAGGTGKTTTEMQTASTFLDAGWDFVGEAANGTEDIWAICEGVDYPHLAWQFSIGDFDADADTDFADLCILAEHWLAADGSFWCGQGCDLTNDGSVNGQDLMVFADNWLAGLD